MGGAMIGSLRREGFDVVVWNRTASKGGEVADAHGAEVAPTAAAAVAAAEVTLSSLADDRAVREAYLGEDGAVAGCAPGTVMLEMSTIAPDTAREMARHVEERGAAFLDSPVSGSVPVAERGELTIMVGGDADVLERVRPVLDAVSAKIFHLGPVGAGATVKLAVNALVHAIDVGLSEALVLAERAGVERSAAYDVIAAGAAGAPFVQYKRPAFEHPEDTPVAFTLDLMGKDLELILSLAREVGAPMAQAELNHELVERALASGLSGRDMSSVAVYLRGSAT
jgi:3-hydroxyisobutyrate dehydrogenase-like beta-hydroxyacid dehydrogenase